MDEKPENRASKVGPHLSPRPPPPALLDYEICVGLLPHVGHYMSNTLVSMDHKIPPCGALIAAVPQSPYVILCCRFP